MPIQNMLKLNLINKPNKNMEQIESQRTGIYNEETNIEKLFCKYCGQRIPVSSKFCPSCGKALYNVNPSIAQNNQAIQQPVYVQQPQPVYITQANASNGL